MHHRSSPEPCRSETEIPLRSHLGNASDSSKNRSLSGRVFPLSHLTDGELEMKNFFAAKLASTGSLAVAVGTLFLAGAGPASALQLEGPPQFGVLNPLTPEQQAILSHLSLVELSDGQGGMVKTIRLSGANFQVVNGLGNTETTNGVGNLIIGYNEFGNFSGDDRTGSHNLVGGSRNSFLSFGGFVVGRGSTVSDRYASVSGGQHNTASGRFSSVSAGVYNTASGDFASVSGGEYNVASGYYASISGGKDNTASGPLASIGGGNYNLASGGNSSVSGGKQNTASGPSSSVSGGRFNEANYRYASVSGGELNTASGRYASVSGGYKNLASGDHASVSGGSSRSALGNNNWAAGSLLEPF